MISRPDKVIFFYKARRKSILINNPLQKAEALKASLKWLIYMVKVLMFA